MREDWQIGKEHPTALDAKFVPLEIIDDVVFGRYCSKFSEGWSARAFFIDGTSNTLDRALPIPPKPLTWHLNIFRYTRDDKLSGKKRGSCDIHGPYETEERAEEDAAKAHRNLEFVRTITITL